MEKSMQKNEKNIYQRIIGVMEDVEYIQKLDKKVNNQYRFVSHDQVTGKLHPALVKHGIVVIPTVKSLAVDGNRTTVCLDVSFVNCDKPEDLVKIESWGFGIDQGDKGPGKAVSYAFKYAMLKVFCLETGDDPDNDAEATHEPEVKSSQKKPESNSVQERPTPLASEEFYYKIFIFIPEHIDPSFGSARNMTDYLNSLASEHISIEKIMTQALRSEEMMKRFCNSWYQWHLKESKK
jgi:hypothetical protein